MQLKYPWSLFLIPLSLSRPAVSVKVVVVGAGTAGLSAARTLIDNWTSSATLDIEVLEGSSVSGGRISTIDLNGSPAEMGASWIHSSAVDHPIFKIADKIGAVTLRTDGDSDAKVDVRMCTEGTETPTDGCVALASDDLKYDVYDAVIDAAAANSADTLSLEEAFATDAITTILGNAGWSVNSPVFQYWLAQSTEFITSGSVSTISAKNWGTDQYWFDSDPDPPDERIFRNGYEVIINALQTGAVRLTAGNSEGQFEVENVSAGSRSAVNVSYNRRVNTITHNSDGVTLGIDGIGNTGAPMEADYVILTTSLGVLKSTTVTFNPALPAATQAAIDTLGFGNVVKVILRFDNVWWNARGDKNYFALAQAGLTQRGRFTWILNVHAVTGVNELMTFALGASADIVEGLTDEVIWTEIRDNLVKIFGTSTAVPTDYTAMVRTAWRQDIHSLGTYTYLTPGTSKETIAVFQANPLSGTVFFAGEHTSEKYWSTVHGAFLSGQDAAREVIAAASGRTNPPTAAPTSAPTSAPTDPPTAAPTSAPISAPTSAPTSAQTSAPTSAQTSAPTSAQTANLLQEVCFSPITTTIVSGKGRVMMKDLMNGDNVLTMDGRYKTMYSMNHYHKSKEVTFVQINTNLESEQPLEISPNHLLYVESNSNPVPASSVEVGDKVWTVEGMKEVLEINMITREGLYNPLTMDGTIIVDGIAASVYTTPTGETHIDIDGVWLTMMKSLSFHDALHMVTAPYRKFCTLVSLDLCNLHEKKAAASSFMETFFFLFWSNQIDFVKFIVASSYVLVFGTLANLTYFKVWILLANICVFSKTTLANKKQ